MKKTCASELGIDVAAVDRKLGEFRSLPIHTYWDPAIYEFEMEAMFARSWQYFAPLEKLSNKGDVVVGQVGKIPIAVARAKDGKLYGFVNACRHRGFRVVEGDKKNCRMLVCRYHAWTYGLTGDLAHAPDTDIEPNFDKSDYGLLRVAVDTCGPGVFVNPDPDSPSLREVHPQIQAWTEACGFDVDPSRYSLYRTITTDQEANWKLWYDNGTECYHCPRIHGKSFGEAFNATEGEYDYRLEGKTTSYSFKASAASDPDALRANTYRSLQIFPGCQFIQHDDIVIIARMTPTGPESCRFTADYFAEAGADPARVNRWIEIWDKTFDEDAEVVIIQQQNLKSGRVPEFRYVSNREEPAIFILGLIWQAYKEHLIDDGPLSRVKAAE